MSIFQGSPSPLDTPPLLSFRNAIDFIILAYIAFQLLRFLRKTRFARSILSVLLARYRKVNRIASEEIIRAVHLLSSQKTGALIVMERIVGLNEFADNGVPLDAQLTFDLLVTLFSPATPLHDGAVIIRRDRIVAAGCFLPLALNPQSDRELGTRHRAAIGITSATDAVTIIVSEETGTISVANEGKITRHLDNTGLRDLLTTILENSTTRQENTISSAESVE